MQNDLPLFALWSFLILGFIIGAHGWWQAHYGADKLLWAYLGEALIGFGLYGYFLSIVIDRSVKILQ